MGKFIRTWIKRRFAFFDRSDIESALANLGNAKDREDFEWKLRQRLFQAKETP